MVDIITLEVSLEDASKRLDVFTAESIDTLTRSNCQKLIDEGKIIVNGKPSKANYKVKSNDEIKIEIEDPVELNLIPQDIPLDILYEDEYLIVVNKPQGMVVHPAPGNYDGTLVNALLFHCEGQLSGINGVIRPGIVHRIDKDTSGVLVIAKTNDAHLGLAEQIKAHSMKRQYLALLHGPLKSEKGTINAPIGRHKTDRKKMCVVQGGREAITHFEVIDRYVNYTLIKAILETGRTHQIRVHMSYIGHPVVGDPVYGPKSCPFKLNGQLLHAQTLGFIHPISKKYMEFSSPLPQYYRELLNTKLKQYI